MANLITSPQRTGFIPITKKEKATFQKKEGNAYNREYGNSPVFSFVNEDITAGASELIDFFQDKPAIQKYGAMTNFIIQNNSSVELKVYLNQSQDRIFTIPAGVIRSFTQEEIQGGVISLLIKNNGLGTATAGLISVETFKVGVQIESTFQKLYKKFSKIGGY